MSKIAPLAMTRDMRINRLMELQPGRTQQEAENMLIQVEKD